MSGLIVLALRLILALTLYGFLGWTLFILWRDIQRQSFSLANRRAPAINLSIWRGSDSFETRYFSQPEISLGRDPSCDIPLSDETVSTRHARLAYHHNQWWLEDLSSTNGTLLNQLQVTMPTVITSGDEIQCGKTRVAISLMSDTMISPDQRMEKHNG